MLQLCGVYHQQFSDFIHDFIQDMSNILIPFYDEHDEVEAIDEVAFQKTAHPLLGKDFYHIGSFFSNILPRLLTIVASP